ncbi:hypothetical protein B0A49_03228 [Cryomyces minteri]|uniref:T6SS Phospholipase effector Tle1-like catalytic domain-containing protein n=1 Tax=Cryomyces minteri TaxID=331657 RepID=A0A4U0XNU9_9PEZI|nr:hypothetical protein B0A49_03228 [Cryomyces minteri]
MLQPDSQSHLPRTATPRGEQTEAVNAPRPPPRKQHKKFVLCFDGTGNKFSGTDADSNILKIYRMLDRNDGSQFHYYQPGIGTYITTGSISHTSRIARIKSCYMKAKDSAIGTSFDEHVMGGYKFLMRYYTPGDDIFFFGFSRGAYTARFLAEMLDHVGLLSAGNEEMVRFAWKTFQKWQVRQDETKEEKAEKRKLLEFMMAFRETFSRPVHRIRFLGLFDTVNSVPRFENAWMQRSKFPYTARSTAKVVRHAVAIDERRAKFRQDLISEVKPSKSDKNTGQRHRRPHVSDRRRPAEANGHDSGRARSKEKRYQPAKRNLALPESFQDRSETTGLRSLSPGLRNDQASSLYSSSEMSVNAIRGNNVDDSDDETEQDIQEVWFAGCHADVGGGWSLEPGEEVPLSHVPLVWMVREAQRAGLVFDETKMRALNCCPDAQLNPLQREKSVTIPQIDISPASPGPEREPQETSLSLGLSNNPDSSLEPKDSPFHRALTVSAVHGRIHDVLQFNNGLPATSVISWNIMEYLPFRRMDLRPGGSWKSVTWPLPRGEVRDVPDDVYVHNSVLKRMAQHGDYRPGNLICGGGGRGVRKAPEKMGMGSWKVAREEGDPVGEVLIRARGKDSAHGEKVDGPI